MNVLKTGMKLTTDVIKPSELATAFNINPDQATKLINRIGEEVNPILKTMPEKDEVIFSIGNMADHVKTEPRIPDHAAIIIQYFKSIFGEGEKPVASVTDFIFKPPTSDLEKNIETQLKRVTANLISSVLSNFK